jgi:class 3 adenylate cyclase
MTRLPVLAVIFNNDYDFYYDAERIHELRSIEMTEYYLSSNGTSTTVIYDQKDVSVTAAEFSMYTTAFVIVLLLGGVYAFSVDVQTLVIAPIEKLVALVKRIAENPLGVQYQMLGADDGFAEGMETTILLTTITKIGGLMKVGFGEAGAAIIARNLQESSGGKLNLLGAGRSIYSIFGFCDVRQFTDTTECLQEEVMLFVNRIAHILHSIVVQCSGAANKNIGDAFLLTWKISSKSYPRDRERIADQALLTFVKALIELSRYQEFICNFSVAASARLFKRFPDYKVRIGCGLHVGWAVEGAIGSNRKIDATYISPHVSTTEFLESSTKEYGVSLLLSEDFYRLLSASAQRHIRQVDRIKRSAEEPPMGLYTYDVDLFIDWNDRFRNRKQSDARSKFISTVRRTSQFLASGIGADAIQNGNLPSIQEVKSVASAASDSHSHSYSHSHHSHHSNSLPHSRNNSKNSVPVVHVPSIEKNRMGSVQSNSGHTPAGKSRGVSRNSVILNNNSNTSNHHTPAHARPSVSAASYSGKRRTSILIKPMGYTEVPLEEVDEENPEKEEEAVEERMRKAKETPTIVVAPYTERVWVEDQDVVDARHLISDAFRNIWAEGMDAFIIGDWTRAVEKFSETFRLSKKKDGPSKRILAFMEEHRNVAPESWLGYRDLTADAAH